MKRYIALILAILGFFAFKTYYQAGQFKTISNNFAGEIQAVYTNVPGPEDMQLDKATGLMFISGAIRRSTYQSGSRIYVLDIAQNNAPKYVPSTLKGDFNPHGISLLREDTTLYLFAINHNNEGDFIESFIYRNDSLHHQNTYHDAEVCCPNDLVAVAPDKFYVTNDHGFSKGNWLRKVEDYLRIPFSNVFYFDGEHFSKAAGPFHYANGINISPDGSTVYLAETTGAAISAFERAEDGKLTLKSTLDVDTGVDNIDVDEDGVLWVAAHPKLLDFVNHVKDSVNLSPSQVLKLVPQPNFTFKVSEIYANDGSTISASSVAVAYKNHLYIGGVLNHALVKAHLSQP